MKTLSKAAAKVLDILTDGLNNPGDSRKIDNSSFMAVHVEMIGKDASGPLFSVAHYFVQNGDMCCDPDMVFLRAHDGAYLPVSFQQAIPPVYQEAMDLQNDTFRPRLMAQLARFANTWMKNIKNQQGLKAARAPKAVRKVVEAPVVVEAPAREPLPRAQRALFGNMNQMSLAL